MSEKVLMSNGVALWLARHTKLSEEQIADFCHMHPLQVIHFRDLGAEGIAECNPIDVSLISLEEISRCEENSSLRLTRLSVDQKIRFNAKKSGLVDGLLWVVKKYPEAENTRMAKLLKCTSAVVKSVKEASYKNLDQVIPKNPVTLGLCSQKELDEFAFKYN